MGTFVAAEAQTESEAMGVAGIEAAFAAIGRVESRMHPLRAGSDLSAIRAAAVGEAVPIDHWTWEVLVLAQRITKVSEGLFDPCPPCDRPGRIADLELDRPGLAVLRAAICIDLGGIAKGFAVDRAIEAMIACGCKAGIVNAGGDLRVFGPARRVLVRTEHGPARIHELDNEALAVSDPAATSRPPEHLGYYRRDYLSSQLLRAAAVVAPSAAVADALTKCVLLAGSSLRPVVLTEFGARSVDDI